MASAHSHTELLVSVLLVAARISAAPLPDRAVSADDYFNRGVQFQHSGNLAEARAAYESGLQLAPERVDILSNLGLTYAGLHLYDKAVRCFEKALLFQPKQPAVLFNLGLTYLQSGKPDRAEPYFREVLATNPNVIAARRFLGIALLQQGHMSEGVSDLQSVLRTNPEDLETIYTLTSSYIKLGDLPHARELVDGPVRKQDTGAAHLIAGSYYMATQDYRQAVTELSRARELDATLPNLGVELGGAYAVTGSQQSAIPLFEARLREHPSDYQSLCLLGWMYLEADRLDEAHALLERARKLRAGDPELLFQLARVARARGDVGSAAVLLERVIKGRPNYLQAHVLLAQSYFQLKRRSDGQRERVVVERLTAEDQARRLQQAQADQGDQARP